MLRRALPFFAALLLTVVLLPAPNAATKLPSAQPAPAFTHTNPQDWLNSKPLTWQDLRGEVVLLEFWTFDCWNCYRSIPWLLELGKRIPELRVIGVHTPELPQEYKRENVLRKVKEFKLTNPVMIDNDYSYWKAMENRYWPAFYLVDKQGRVRSLFIGETHEGDANARKIESAVRELLAES